jgi:LPLT family lysophospholipid transporter-like MFS transporter
LQGVFLAAFVTLAPWVGPCADQFPKPRVLTAANLLKALGTVLIMSGVEPLLAYAVVGAGAAVYSPAKYGILPELVPHAQLVTANSWVEGATIAAILVGTVTGAKLADHSPTLALGVTAALYLLSAMASWSLPRLPPRGANLGLALRQLLGRMSELLVSARARIVLISLSLFWASAATLRIVLIAWAPLVLGIRTAGQIAELTLFLAIGIVLGSGVVPRLIPLEHIRRARLPAYSMALCFLLLANTQSIWPARAILLGIGIAGGMFVVPLNATMQQIGHLSIGSGAAVAIQNLFQNLTMLAAVGACTLAAARGGSPVTIILVLGGLVLVATVLVSGRLPKNRPQLP